MEHVLILPYPNQGHINPMLQFAERLSTKGPRTTLVTTSFIVNSIKAPSADHPVRVAAISDGHDEGGFASASSLEAYLDRLSVVGSESLAKLIAEEEQLGFPFTCIVYDTFVPWASDVGKKLGLPTVAFSTQSCAVSAIYYYVNKGKVELPAAGSRVRVSAPGLPLMERSEFPSFALGSGSYPTLTAFALNQFNLEKDDWLLFNSFDELENEVMKSFKEQFCNARAIGPCMPIELAAAAVGHQHSSVRSSKKNSTYEMSLLEMEEDACMKWLDAKPSNSVVYVSFGSFASLSLEQMEELANGLRQSDQYFLWVVREKEQKSLPAAEGYFKSSEKGLIVKWSPQLRVLAHEAVGCFLTHCGWNSTLEALSIGVPMVAMPLWTDQPTNAKYVEDVWEVGVRAKPDGGCEDEIKGIIKRDEIERCIREVMDGGAEKAQMIRRNSDKWSNLAKKALSDGGSSEQNLDEFVEFVKAKAKEQQGARSSLVDVNQGDHQHFSEANTN